MKKLLVGLAIGVIALYFVLRGVDWAEVANHLQGVDFPLLLLAMIGMLAAYGLMAWRWRFLLQPLAPDAHLGWPNLYGATMSGYFFNSFFPARAGDVVRAHLVGKQIGLRKTTILATVVIEKLFDGLALLLLLALGLPALRFAGGSEQLGIIALVALALVFAGLFLFRRNSARMIGLVSAVLDFLPVPARLREVAVRLLRTFAEGLGVFEKPGPLLISAGISLLVWLAAVGMFWAAMAAFHLDGMTPLGLFFLTGLVNLGLLVPAMPGNVGNYEGLVIAGLALIFPGIDKEQAVAFALVFHAGQLATTLLVGGLLFWRQNVSLKEVQAEEGPILDDPAADAELAAHAQHKPHEEAAELGIEKL